MHRLIETLIRLRWWVLAGLLAITVGFAALFPRAVIATNMTELFFSQDDQFDVFLDVAGDFTSDAAFLYAYPQDDPFSLQALARLQALVDDIYAQDGIARVISLLDAAQIEATSGSLQVRRYADLARRHPDRASALFEELRADPDQAGQFVSQDGTHLLLAVEPAAERWGQVEHGIVVHRHVQAMFAKHGYAPGDLKSAGVSTVSIALTEQAKLTLTRMLPIVFVVQFLVGLLLFRRLFPVLAALTVGLVAMIWTMGFALIFNPQVNIFLALVPIVILVLSFSDVVHLCSAYLIELRHGLKKHAAIVESGAEVGRACLLTSVTTFFGFVALAFVPSPIIRQFGLILGFGVGATLLIAVTFVPVLLAILPQPRVRYVAEDAEDRTENRSAMDRLLFAVERLSTGRPRLVVAMFAVLILLCLAGITRLDIDASFAEMFDADHEVRRDEAFFQAQFGGMYLFPVFVDTGVIEGVLDPERLAKIEQIQTDLIALPQVRSAHSAVDVLHRTHDELQPVTDPAPWPPDRATLAQYLLMIEMSGADNPVAYLMDPERQRLQVMLQLDDDSVRDAYAVGQHARARGAALLGARAEIFPGGGLYFIGKWLDQLVAGQLRGLGFSAFVITALMVIGLRSWRLGLWSMIPNLLPLLVLGGFLGVARDPAHSDNIIAAMIAIGIGVDDTIHFLMRWRVELARGVGVYEAIHRTFRFAGRSIVITSVILVCGFLPLAWGDYLTVVILGSMLPLTLFVALAADLLLVPALVALGWVRPPAGITKSA